jgi:rRNA maturation endonuclease Nob1
MSSIILDANAVIMHGRAFPERVRTANERGDRLILPQTVKEELVDDVLANANAPENHRDSARTIETLIEEGPLRVRAPDFEQYSGVIDEARRRIADESLPEHAVRADQYIPALVCELAEDGPVQLVTADRKLRGVVRDIAERRNVNDVVTIADPGSVL